MRTWKLINLLFFALQFIYDNHEDNCLLHLDGVKSMFILLYVAGYHNYARVGRAKDHSESTIKHPKSFLMWRTYCSTQARYIQRNMHCQDQWKIMQEVRSQFFIRSSSAGNQSETMKTWAYNPNACYEIVTCLDSMLNNEGRYNQLHKTA